MNGVARRTVDPFAAPEEGLAPQTRRAHPGMIRAALADAHEGGTLPATPYQPSPKRRKAIDQALGIESAAAKPLWHDAVLNARRQDDAETAAGAATPEPEVPAADAASPSPLIAHAKAWIETNLRVIVAAGVGLTVGIMVVLVFG